MNERADKMDLASEGFFNPKLYDFVDTQIHHVITENYEDIIEDKIFKYKYRQNSDSHDKYV